MKKLFNAISAIILAGLFWYAMYIFFFVSAIVWVGNIIMFYMNFLFFIYLMFMFINENKVAEIKKQKFFPWQFDAFEFFVMAFIFAAFGWWYYATISVIIFTIIIGKYHKSEDK